MKLPALEMSLVHITEQLPALHIKENQYIYYFVSYDYLSINRYLGG